MLKDMLTILGRQLRPAFFLLIALSVITGLVYPAAITLAAKALFPAQAEGSLITDKGAGKGADKNSVIGSALLGQQFADPGHFWGRPSATSPQPYNASASGGGNLTPAGAAQLKAVQERAEALRAADKDNTLPIPADLLTASGSGLDPHISPAAAAYQIPRIAKARGMDKEALAALVARHTQSRQLGFLGEARVNVLLLNRELDSLVPSVHTQTKP